MFYLYRTNIGNSLTKGTVIFVQADWNLGNTSVLSVFTSTSFTHARYEDATVKSGNTNINIKGNKVETVPDIISRNGATFRFGRCSISGLFTYTVETFADALNTIQPSPTTGAVGIVPSYAVLDINGTIRLSKHFELRVNINIVTNKQYFTKRPSFYPGPGVWPSHGRNGNVSFAVRL